MRSILCGALLVLSCSANAGGVYKCKVNGKTVYQEQPCAGGGGEEVQIRNDGPSELEQLRAENRALRNQQAYGGTTSYERASERFDNTWREVNRADNESYSNARKEQNCMRLSERSSDMSLSSNERAEANYQSSKMRCH